MTDMYECSECGYIIELDDECECDVCYRCPKCGGWLEILV